MPATSGSSPPSSAKAGDTSGAPGAATKEPSPLLSAIRLDPVVVRLAHAGEADHRLRAGNVHARDPTRAGGGRRAAELLQPAHQRVVLRAVPHRPPVRAGRRHRPAPADHRGGGPARRPRRLPARAASPGGSRAWRRRSSASAPASTRSRRWRCSRCWCRSPGCRATTVVIGLALYALTILVRSMLEGLRAVPDEVRESATGLGYGASRAAVQGRAPARAAGDHGRPPGRHRVHGRADDRRARWWPTAASAT